MILDAVREHYVNLWGPPARKARFAIQGHVVEIHKWDVESTDEGVALYATIGLSTHQLERIHPDHRIELYVGLLPEEDAIAKPFAMLAVDPVLNSYALGDGHSVTFTEPLWTNTSMNSFLVARAAQVIVPPLLLSDETHVEFLQAIPLYEEEVQFKAMNGIDGLRAVWRGREVPFWNPMRRSTIDTKR